MILILSESRDISTHKVIAWLNFFDVAFIRLNDRQSIFDIFVQKDALSINELFIDKHTMIWDRRGNLAHDIQDNSVPDKMSEILQNQEWKTLKDYVYYIFEKNGISSFRADIYHNKLIDLDVAEKIGFKTPPTFLLTSKKDLEKIYSTYKLITKPIKNPINLKHNNFSYTNIGTCNFDSNDLEQMPPTFFPTLFQEKIEKLFEIRVFYFLDTCYSMAIFSQFDEKTNTDYRNYNREKPNRNVPFKLPVEIENKVKDFMREKKLKTGSIDFIYSTEKEFIFLEVNPSGQFDWVSISCNFPIEKDIANALINYGRK